MPDINEELSKKYNSRQIREAQQAILNEAEIPDAESVMRWLDKRYSKKKKPEEEGSILTHGVPQ